MTDTATAAPSQARDSARTREAILRAAQSLFAAKGYTTTGVREIAATAGVNSTLVRRYFGSKEGLLRASLEGMLGVDEIVAGDRGAVGERAAAALLRARGMADPVSIMMLAMADLSARRLCADLVQERVIAPLAAWLGGANAADRAAQLNVLWTGFIVQRHLPVHELTDPHVALTQEWVARTTQAIVDAG